MRTTAGYAGGEEPDPSYRRMKDHTETVRVEFDPRVISYRQLLDLFWNSHDASNKVHSRQYRNAVFYTSEAQRQAAQADKQRLQEMKKRPVHTAIERAGAFYPAEDYHQKYYLRRYDQLLQELRRFYATEEALAASTAAARLNGYLGCHGQPKQLTEEIGRLGLSLEAQHYLLDYVKNGCRGFASIRCALPPLDAGDKEQRMGSRE